MAFRACVLALVGLWASAAGAQSPPVPDDELSRIPTEEPKPPPTEPASAPRLGRIHGTLYVESATQAAGLRSNLDVPSPPPNPPKIEARLFADALLEWIPRRDLSIHFSGRAGLRVADDLPFPTHENIRVDWRELYLSWQPFNGAFVDLGRINLKSGVALGFNPTDFFKTRAVVEPLSVDPAALREDRLGTLMLRGQYTWSFGSISAAYAPRLTSVSPLYTNSNLPSVDPMFDRTNAHHRLLVKGNVDLFGDFSPEVLFYDEDGNLRWGANIAQSLGKKVVAYAEWAGGREAGLANEALSYGVRTGSLPSAAASALGTSSSAHFQNDLSAGLSYANESKMTFWLEYHLHQAGFSRQDWSTWFAEGTGPGGSFLAPTLWYIRGYAQEQQAPASKHALFLRADWTDAFVFNLELTAFANVNLYDGSTLAQVTASYSVTNLWTVGLIGAANIGTRQSEFGSLPTAISGLFTVRRHF
jgi:hypothetical protein